MSNNRKPLFLISTDWHLKGENMFELLDIALEEVQLAKELKVKAVIWLGDMFDSRVAQSQQMLNALSYIINLHTQAEIDILCIPGNHDKTDYSADDSFLSVYQHHPGFNLYMEPTDVPVWMYGIGLHFLPYYKNDVWLKKFEGLPAPQEKEKTVLFSHTAVQGSVNNNGKAVENGISLSLFKPYEKVFLGHYHDQQQPGRNVFHLPSVRQNNFGENEDKGFTILYDDCSFEFRKSEEFTPYREVTIDAETVTQEELASLANEGIEGINLRYTFTGDQQSIKKINRKKFTDAGINVKVKYTEVDVAEVDEQPVARELTGNDIKEKFEAFCAEKGYDVEKGLELLNHVMKWQNQ